jgi:hypothetical protein
MAIFKKPVAVVKPIAKPIHAPVKTVAKVAKQDGFEVVDMTNIMSTLVTKGGGGGRGLSPFATKAFSLEHGQGFKISDEKYGENGKGMASTYAGAARRGIKLRVRRDINNQLWLFRVTEEQEIEAAERKAARDAESAAA